MRVSSRPWRRFALTLSSIAVICVPTLVAEGAGASTPVATQSSAQSSSTSPWQIQKTANPQLKVEEFNGDSCTSATYCVAVGTRLNDSGIEVTLAEQWNGSNWQMMRTANPKGAEQPDLAGVSCSSSTNCVAVGSDSSTDGFPSPIAESWDGTTWTLDTLPGLTEGGSLYGVSCVAADQCMAVGYRLSLRAGQVGLALSWNGSTWTQTKVAPTPGLGSSLASVSCTSASACEAVGDASAESGELSETSLAEVWNGSTWSLQKTPNPKGGALTSLSGVSCTSVSDCVTVGSSFSDELVPTSLAEVWNGTGWRITPTPAPSGSEEALLFGVSCSSSGSSSSCVAVGEAIGDTYLTLAMGWNGTTWTLETSIDPSPEGEEFAAVSCISGSSCVAVGSSEGAKSPSTLLVESWNGTIWSTQMAFGKPGEVSATLDRVSCVGTSFCLAVGVDELENPIAEVSNGSAWKFTSAPVSGGGGGFDGVSCVTTTDCIAVGPAQNLELGVAEQWNGKTWTELTTPEGFGALDGISCTSATDCIAVGGAESDTGSGGVVTLAEAWNGETWTVTPTPNPAGSEEAELLSTSCTGADSCVAVGVSQSSTGVDTPIVQTWNGHKWTAGSSAGSNLGSLGLTGVSCTSSTDCLAVGYTIDRTGSTDAFSEVWNGSVWTAEKTPTPNGGAEVFDVQCSSSSNCVSVGERARGALAESWNGTAWAIEKTASPPGSDGSAFFNGVNCTSASCTAVGGYTNSRGLGLTLAEAT